MYLELYSDPLVMFASMLTPLSARAACSQSWSLEALEELREQTCHVQRVWMGPVHDTRIVAVVELCF